VSLFRLDASIRTEGSVSREVADTVVVAWSQTHPDAAVTRRDVGTNPLPATAWQNAVTGGWVDPAQRTPQQHAAIAMATALADELIAADAYVIATPLYNYGVQPNLKAWLDLVITDPRFAPGGEQPLAGRPLVLVVARGGGYGEGTPKYGWDHATPYLQRIFGEVFGMDVHLVEAELTLADVVPAMESLRPLAAELRQNAHIAAGEHGTTVAARIREAATTAA
jgi:FMN-dependent NADH-azoreductase